MGKKTVETIKQQKNELNKPKLKKSNSFLRRPHKWQIKLLGEANFKQTG